MDHLPSGGQANPAWLWWSKIDATEAEVDRCWQAFLRRFDIEHTFRLFKQTLGWTVPKLREPEAADRWTWLIITVHAQLRLARALATDLRRPWEKPAPPKRLTPARIRRGFAEPPHEDPVSSVCTKTLPARSWTAAQLDKPPNRQTP